MNSLFIVTVLSLFCHLNGDIIPLTSQDKLISEKGYKSEKHEVKTSDGYILTLFRIPGKNPKAMPVLIMHGLLGSSDLFTLHNYSLAYSLYENGNDVWLGNFRGSVHSRKHETLKPSEKDYWNFSFQEMSLLDLPAMINYILKTTGHQKIHTIGYSMGTTALFILGSEKPEFNSKLKSLIALAPIATCKKYMFIAQKGSPMEKLGLDIAQSLKDNNKWEAFPRKDTIKTDHQIQCTDYPEELSPYCMMAMDMAKSTIGDYLPAGTSLKTLEHYFQCFSTGELSYFDYGSDINLKKYKQKEPPKYKLDTLKIPVHLFYSEGDQVYDAEEIDELAGILPNVALKNKIDNDDFTHADYVVISNADIEKAYSKMVSQIKELVMK